MKLNQDKCHLLVPGHKYENIFENIGQSLIWESPKEELLGLDIDKDLKFNESGLFKYNKVGQNLSVSERIPMGTQRFKNVFKTLYLGDSVHATRTFKVHLKNVSKT